MQKALASWGTRIGGVELFLCPGIGARAASLCCSPCWSGRNDRVQKPHPAPRSRCLLENMPARAAARNQSVRIQVRCLQSRTGCDCDEAPAQRGVKHHRQTSSHEGQEAIPPHPTALQGSVPCEGRERLRHMEKELRSAPARRTRQSRSVSRLIGLAILVSTVGEVASINFFVASSSSRLALLMSSFS